MAARPRKTSYTNFSDTTGVNPIEFRAPVAAILKAIHAMRSRASAGAKALEIQTANWLRCRTSGRAEGGPIGPSECEHHS